MPPKKAGGNVKSKEKEEPKGSKEKKGGTAVKVGKPILISIHCT